MPGHKLFVAATARPHRSADSLVVILLAKMLDHFVCFAEYSPSKRLDEDALLPQ